jgi:hypothetical protein
LSSALIAQLEALQVVAGDTAGALNAQGETLEVHVQDIPMHVREVALHGIHRGAVVALAIALVRSGLDLCLAEPGFLEEENPNDYQGLVDDFEGAGAIVADITSTEE